MMKHLGITVAVYSAVGLGVMGWSIYRFNKGLKTWGGIGKSPLTTFPSQVLLWPYALYINVAHSSENEILPTPKLPGV